MSERSIFLGAVEVADAGERAGYLEKACVGDAGLRGRVEELIAAEGKLGGVFGAARMWWWSGPMNWAEFGSGRGR